MHRIRHTIETGMFVREAAPADPSARAGTLLFLHGLGESGLSFEGALTHSRLAAYRRIALDLPGYGRSPWSREPLSLVEQADLVAAWLAERSVDPIVLVGHSMGGVSGLYLCERHPELVAHFVNVEGNVTLGDCSYSRLALAYDYDGFLDHGFRELLECLYEEGREDPPKRGYFASMRHCDPRLFHRNGGELVDVSASETVPERLAALPLPVTHVPGVPDGNPRASREKLEQAGIQLRPIEPAGHWPFLDRPDDFAAILGEIADRTFRPQD